MLLHLRLSLAIQLQPKVFAQHFLDPFIVRTNVTVGMASRQRCALAYYLSVEPQPVSADYFLDLLI